MPRKPFFTSAPWPGEACSSIERIIRFSIGPGFTVFTRIPTGASSHAATFIRPIVACLLATYAESPRDPMSPAIDDVMTMLPPPRFVMCGTAAWMPGDLGYYNEKGEFFHLDRAVDVIHTAHGPVYTLPTEEKIQNDYPELADASVIGVDDDNGHQTPIAFVWGVNGSDGLDAARMLEELNRKHASGKGKFLSALAVVTLENIPLGATGKVLKRELREKYQNLMVDARVRMKVSGNVALA